MTIIERLERMSRLGGDNETEFVQVQTADLSALLECVRAQHEWIHYPLYTETAKLSQSRRDITRRSKYYAKRTLVWSAVVEAEKKVGLKP